jgi:hypothetical protein
LIDRVAEPDLDRGDVDGSLEDVLAFVGARRDRAEGLELVDGAFGGVALLVGRGVERRWSPAGGPFAARAFCWSLFSGIVVLICRRRRWERIARFE